MTQYHDPGAKHPPEWRGDLNPNAGAGQNIGLASDVTKSEQTRYAGDIKDLANQMQGYSADDLKRIPIVPAGSRLEQGALYLDLRTPGAKPFKALGNQSATEHQWLVPKSDVDYVLWNRLTGVDNPARLDEEDSTQ